MKFLSLAVICLLSFSLLAQKNKPLKVSKVIVQIPEGKPIVFVKNPKKDKERNPAVYNFRAFRSSSSFYAENIKSNIEEEFVDRGFKVQGWGNLFHELNEEVEPKLAIGLIIKDFLVQRNALYTKVEAIGKYNWQVLDLESNRIIYNQTLESTFYTESPVIEYSSSGQQYYNYAQMIDSNIHRAVTDLLADSIFREILNEKPNRVEGLSDSSRIEIPKIAKSSSTGFLENALNGTVTIKSPLGFGSGFFINNQGMILTCYHTIKKSSPVKVFLKQGLSVEAEVVRINPEYDLALLQIKEVHSTPLVLGLEVKRVVGDKVFVVGTPASKLLENSVSRGILSAERSIENKKYLQTDASVSPGNSGGPILNKEGEVIGVVNAKVVSFGAEGIGFAIPIEVALEKLNLEFLLD